MQLLLRVVLMIAAVAGMAGTSAAQDILTITGKIGVTNRPQYEPFHDAFFKHHERKFKKAFAFDKAALAALPQHEVNARVEGWPAAVAGRGPRLKDVLDAAKVDANARLFVMALDGYAAEFAPGDVVASDWIVALEVDGKPLGIGGRGPAWLMYDTGGKPIQAAREAQWVWSAFLIVAE